jgi:competence protein ComEC
VNDTSVIVEMAYKTTSFLFTGDASAAVEERLLQRKSVHPVDVLKVAHHGSVYSSSIEFLDAVTPDYAIISVGRGNSYGHPHGIVIDRLKARGAEVLRTDEVGEVRVVSDGEGITIDN